MGALRINKNFRPARDWLSRMACATVIGVTQAEPLRARSTELNAPCSVLGFLLGFLRVSPCGWPKEPFTPELLLRLRQQLPLHTQQNQQN